ncbi:cilia- and flagella-associated protein 43 isoform X2 [Topomyia yanbarensis]|uniref:cilia- and flagella-associated protein 43 isoform X2 n=1 Tax=Topomyia yanbarensis TaxID=2498891 RepID=UPI00273BD80C|nr:cilia- and flagella-associated protein 43 isoform X2 [Topomyia yanbarensis]
MFHQFVAKMSLKHMTNVKSNWSKVRDIRAACFVADVALAVAMDSHILLVNLSTKIETFYRAVDKTNGDGVSCIAGHRTFSIFGFAENCAKPRIFLIGYPENSILYVLEGDEHTFSYISICFSDSEYLVALCGVPDYSIEVYAWRNKELLAKQKTTIHTDNQKILCSPTTTVEVCQLAYKNAQVVYWEIHGNIRFCKLIEKIIKLPFSQELAPLDCAFSVDGTLMIVNGRGTVYSFAANSGQVNEIIAPREEPLRCTPLIYYCKGGLLVGEPERSVSFHKRQKGSWSKMWSTKLSEEYSLLLHYCASKGLYGITTSGNLVCTLVDNDIRNVHSLPIKELSCQVKTIVIVNPLGDTLVCSNFIDELIIASVATGARLSKYAVGQMHCIQEHPLYPFIVVGTYTGIVQLLSLHRPEEPSLLTDFHLCHVAIKSIRFSNDGLYIAVFDVDNNLFCIKGLPGGSMDVIYHVVLPENLPRPIFSVRNNTIEIVGLMNDRSRITSQVMHISIALENKISIFQIKELTKKYAELDKKIDGDSLYLAIAYRTNDIDILEIIYESDACLRIKKCGTIKVKHQVPQFMIHVDQFHIVTWSIDGLISIYDSKTDKLLAFFVDGNRTNGGIQLARCDPLHQYIITLSYTGCLVCTKVHRSAASVQLYNDMKLKLKPDDVMAMFRTPTTGFRPIEFSLTRWIDMEKISRLEREELECEHDKMAILNDFQTIKTKLRELLDANETALDQEQLCIQSFNLNVAITEQLKAKAKVERDIEHRRLLNYIVSQERANAKIIKKCWDVMERKPVKVRSILTKLAVENYPSLPKERDEQFIQKIGVYRNTEHMASHDALLPWKPTPTYQLESILNRDPEYGNMIDVLSRSMAKKCYSLTGTTTHLFVEPMPLRFEQLEAVTFEQLYFENIYGNIEILKLRDAFNKKFDELKTLKNNEMDTVLKRNIRLRIIQQELLIMSELLETDDFIPEIIVDPCFQPDEIPNTIVKIENHEISVTQYLTPSTECLLAFEKAERERRQRELMADDFKDRALMVMMDGVLEHRWEDEIKKTPSTPQCLETGKDPQYYTETDLREVKEYEDQLEFLSSERKRYKQILGLEKVQTVKSLEDQIKKFNTIVGQCLLEKIRIESAIREEEIRILRNSLFHHQRLIFDRDINHLRHGIDVMQKQIDELTEIIAGLQDKVVDYKNTYETLNTKDKMLDKQFKINFSDTAQSAIVDQAYKIFKKRPKAQLRAAITVSVFQDLAKRITVKKANQKSKILLPQECVDHLSACEILDNTTHCPAGMDSNMWHTLCKMRRFKMESEFRLKSCEIQLADAETALYAFQREIASKKNQLAFQESQIRQLLHVKFEDSTNRNVQIILKLGFIEVPMSGHLVDFDSCILIHRTDVDDINVIIKRAGAKKLKAMINAAMFRRRIISLEWEHKALRLKIRDMKDQIKMIEKCKITKEVQEWLKRKEMSTMEDLGQLALEREIENTIYAEDKMLMEVRKSVEELEERIQGKRKENKLLDKQIQELNVDVTEQHLQKNSELETIKEEVSRAKMSAIIDRARLVRLVQAQHSQILELGTMLELQRLKTYPTLTAPPTLIHVN